MKETRGAQIAVRLTEDDYEVLRAFAKNRVPAMSMSDVVRDLVQKLRSTGEIGDLSDLDESMTGSSETPTLGEDYAIFRSSYHHQIHEMTRVAEYDAKRAHVLARNVGQALVRSADQLREMAEKPAKRRAD